MNEEDKTVSSPHLELKISVTDEMIRDYQECAECAEKESGKDCSTCSWDEVKIGELALCCLMDLEKVLEGAITMTNREAYDNMWDELEQYRKIGTVEECREAVERQKPKKPDFFTENYTMGGFRDDYKCPECGRLVRYFESGMNDKIKMNYCPDCGQAIQWEGRE